MANRWPAGDAVERLGTPADLAPVVVFLASPAVRWINGQTIMDSSAPATRTWRVVRFTVS